MVDILADSIVETYRGIEIKRKPYDPYGGPAQYYAELSSGKSPTYSNLADVRTHIDDKIVDVGDED